MSHKSTIILFLLLVVINLAPRHASADNGGYQIFVESHRKASGNTPVLCNMHTSPVQVNFTIIKWARPIVERTLLVAIDEIGCYQKTMSSKAMEEKGECKMLLKNGHHTLSFTLDEIGFGQYKGQTTFRVQTCSQS